MKHSVVHFCWFVEDFVYRVNVIHTVSCCFYAIFLLYTFVKDIFCLVLLSLLKSSLARETTLILQIQFSFKYSEISRLGCSAKLSVYRYCSSVSLSFTSCTLNVRVWIAAGLTPESTYALMNSWELILRVYYFVINKAL